MPNVVTMPQWVNLFTSEPNIHLKQDLLIVFQQHSLHGHDLEPSGKPLPKAKWTNTYDTKDVLDHKKLNVESYIFSDLQKNKCFDKD